MIKEYNGNNLIKNGILYFYSSWVSTCNIPKSNLSYLENKYKNIDMMKINTTKFHDVKKIYNIKIIPSFIIIKDTELVSQLDGISNKITLDKWILNNIN